MNVRTEADFPEGTEIDALFDHYNETAGMAPDCDRMNWDSEIIELDQSKD